jgi:bifunctional non-homologous end joining protein LigD
MTDKLALYKSKRDFKITSEPAEGGEVGQELTFVVQKHWASRLHYDLRLEWGGVMLSWAVPKGPSYDTADKRMAVHVEDHPISYSSFEGDIPEGEYGAGKVIVWDAGTWHPLGDAEEGLRKGNLKFELRGKKLRGRWVLVRMKKAWGKQEAWLLIKERDEYARPSSEFSVVDEFPDSVKALLGMETAKPAKKAARKTDTPAKQAGTLARKTKAAAAATLAGMPPEAVKSALPETLSPQLATLVDGPPPDPKNWVYEIKFDGYRVLTRIEGKDVKLFTRNGNDWTHRLPALHAALLKARLPEGWYDGEIVVLSSHGVPDFGALQNSFDAEKTKGVVYYLFDVPYMGGFDLREAPVVARRELLRQALLKNKSDALRFSDVFDAPPASVVTSACQLGLEGVIAKRKDSTYRSSRSDDWIKLKCSHRQEFVIGGWTDPKGTRTGLGSLLLGVHDDQGALLYAGNVGTGFNKENLAEITSKLAKVASPTNPFPSKEGIIGRPHWVKPTLVAEVTFGEWTDANRIRHAVFHGLRTDKPASSIVRETAASAPKAAKPKASVKTAIDVTQGRAETPASAPAPAGPVSHALSSRLRITHPERVIDTSTGITKLELVRYYALVGELMMEHLKGRPVSLVRAPTGIGAQLFFQKHAETEKLIGIEQLDPALYPSHPAMLEIVFKEGVLSAAQWNVVEFHTLNTGTTSFEHPDRLVFDLDPGEGVSWEMIQQGAQAVKIFLDQLGLASFLKTSGGKGLHVVVPIEPTTDWDTARGFSQAVVQHLSKMLPKMFVAKAGGSNRVGRIFIDWLRNGLGATTACAWSARARPGLGISVPVAWDELDLLKGGDHWTIRTAQMRLDKGNEPWSTYETAAKKLQPAMKMMDYKLN